MSEEEPVVALKSYKNHEEKVTSSCTSAAEAVDSAQQQLQHSQPSSEEQTQQQPAQTGLVARCCTQQCQVYASHFLSSWGDRMWMFAGGLFLLEVTPGSLRLAAIYGAALALTVIMMGAPVGRWVDRTSRLTAAQLSLATQNVMVCVCAALLVLITSQPHVFRAWHGWALTLAEAGVILTACVAQIGTLGSKLAIEKDWILVICGTNQARLARMNSVLRTVDLSTEVLAPVMVGAVMTGLGLVAGGVVIAGWNVGSLVVEYSLLRHLYHSSQALQKPKLAAEGARQGDEVAGAVEEVQRVRRWRWVALDRLMGAWQAWVAYMTHPVRDAGLALALLFMTVLAFDNYSRAFVYDSGVSESVLGLLTALASLCGIAGSLTFPHLRTKLGVAATGMIGFVSELVCLVLCVASVFAPGSPFEPWAVLQGVSSAPTQSTSLSVNSSTTAWVTSAAINITQDPADNTTTTAPSSAAGGEEVVDNTFVILLLSGIISSRFGLWVADLTVTQVLQEGVAEGQRGAINGVQSSLNQTLDLLRSILLIILPRRNTFGFLIILSFVFVFMGTCMFGVFACRSPKLPTAPPEGEVLKPATA